LSLDVAVLTNLGRDHLDYHYDRDAYLAAKVRILELLRPSPQREKAGGTVVLNAADPAFLNLELGGLPVVRYTARSLPDGAAPADLWVESSELTMDGSRLTLVHAEGTVEVTSPLVGWFNVENLTAAVAAGVALGLPLASCAEAAGKVEQVPGRMERHHLPQGGIAIVDYAHSPDALTAVLVACGQLTSGRLLVVFGCGGDRDRGKRELMGAVAARAADLVWITSDNPRSEDPEAIMAAIACGYAGVAQPRAQSCQQVEDRTTAIEQALAAAGDGDIVVVAGKGHENYQLVGQERRHLDDREIIKEWIGGQTPHG
jgi:UDP-N-acetylmuramoyl-L-alanyl-D-glutamate--2,6-diaminopimelate ligase